MVSQVSPNSNPVFSILTVTYNRVDKIPRIWNCLNRIRNKNFEWIIVDNASNDGTRTLVQTWRKKATFEIKYHRLQCNEGKAKGLNAGKQHIAGDYVIVLDDDDILFDNALCIAQMHISELQFADDNKVGQLTFRGVDEFGKICGESSQGKSSQRTLIVDSTALEMFFVLRQHNLYGGGISVTKTKVFCEFEFLELPPPNNDLLKMVQFRVARKYRTFYIDFPLRIAYAHDGIIRMNTRPRYYNRMSLGGYMTHLIMLNEQVDYFWHEPRTFTRSAKNLCVSGLHIGKTIFQQYSELNNFSGRLLWFVFGLIPGSFKFFADIVRIGFGLIDVRQSRRYEGY